MTIDNRTGDEKRKPTLRERLNGIVLGAAVMTGAIFPPRYQLDKGPLPSPITLNLGGIDDPGKTVVPLGGSEVVVESPRTPFRLVGRVDQYMLLTPAEAERKLLMENIEPVRLGDLKTGGSER